MATPVRTRSVMRATQPPDGSQCVANRSWPGEHHPIAPVNARGPAVSAQAQSTGAGAGVLQVGPAGGYARAAQETARCGLVQVGAVGDRPTEARARRLD